MKTTSECLGVIKIKDLSLFQLVQMN